MSDKNALMILAMLGGLIILLWVAIFKGEDIYWWFRDLFR